jgi:ATP-dependent Clp protease protease subunit
MSDEIMVRHTGQTPEAIQRDSDRDFFMGADEAKEYGLVDEVFRRDKKKALPR